MLFCMNFPFTNFTKIYYYYFTHKIIQTRLNSARAFSMTRLDQLAQPVRRNGEHIRAIIERERQQALELENLSRLSMSRTSPSSDEQRRKSRSMSQLAAAAGAAKRRRDLSAGNHHKLTTTMTNGNNKVAITNGGDRSGMRKSDTSKSMSQLADDGEKATRRARMTRSEKLRQQVKEQLSNSALAGANPIFFLCLFFHESFKLLQCSLLNNLSFAQKKKLC